MVLVLTAILVQSVFVTRWVTQISACLQNRRCTVGIRSAGLLGSAFLGLM